MSEGGETTLTDHALLVVWGQFAQCLGLVQGIRAIPLDQQSVDHRPQGKVLEFFVAVLAGLEYLKDISLSAHPLDKDLAVARAWGQAGWADYSGVSRTLSQLSQADVEGINGALEQVSQPLLDREVVLALERGPLELDGDLSPRPVSNTSQTYPEADYGHMNDRLQRGYQAAIVSMRSPTYRRIELSATQPAGQTVSASQAEALALEAERGLGRRPMRRTDLLEQRLDQRRPQGQRLDQRVAQAPQHVAEAKAAQATVERQLDQAVQQLEVLQAEYAQHQRPERPSSALAKARQQVEGYQRRLERRRRAVAHQQAWQVAWQAHQDVLQARLKRFQAENAANPAPISAIFRLDAGFGTPTNLALLIEMGYEVYSKPYGTWLSGVLTKMSAEHQTWQKVGRNADMMAWPSVQLDDFPYPLDLGYERFWTGDRYRFSGLLHFGLREVTADLPGWFHDYNARQILEAGNKEGKQVFEVHHLKVRARPALPLQEHFGLFAANFVRFASHWLAEPCLQVPHGWQHSACPHVKEQVKVGAHSSATVEWIGQDCLVRFEDRSVYAGQSFQVSRQIAIPLALPMKFAVFSPI